MKYTKVKSILDIGNRSKSHREYCKSVQIWWILSPKQDPCNIIFNPLEHLFLKLLPIFLPVQQVSCCISHLANGLVFLNQTYGFRAFLKMQYNVSPTALKQKKYQGNLDLRTRPRTLTVWRSHQAAGTGQPCPSPVQLHRGWNHTCSGLSWKGP